MNSDRLRNPESRARQCPPPSTMLARKNPNETLFRTPRRKALSIARWVGPWSGLTAAARPCSDRTTQVARSPSSPADQLREDDTILPIMQQVLGPRRLDSKLRFRRGKTPVLHKVSKACARRPRSAGSPARARSRARSGPRNHDSATSRFWAARVRSRRTSFRYGCLHGTGRERMTFFPAPGRPGYDSGFQGAVSHGFRRQR